MFLVKGHRQAHPLAHGKLGALCESGQSMLDGFLPMAVHLQGFSIVIRTFYNRCGLKFSGLNLGRFARL
eukprot:9498041-Pyramimonas_sp.AAC.1